MTELETSLLAQVQGLRSDCKKQELQFETLVKQQASAYTQLVEQLSERLCKLSEQVSQLSEQVEQLSSRVRS